MSIWHAAVGGRESGWHRGAAVARGARAETGLLPAPTAGMVVAVGEARTGLDLRGVPRRMSTRKAPSRAEPHAWQFKASFRRHAFGWKSQPAITRIRQAVAEIKKVAKTDPVLAAEGAVAFLERVSPAIEQVDGSSGSIGTAVGNAVGELVPLIARAPAGAALRAAWLERLFQAHEADQMPYIERLADF
jgi:hypothetical protein